MDVGVTSPGFGGGSTLEGASVVGPASLGDAARTDRLSVCPADRRGILGKAVDALARTSGVRDNEEGTIGGRSRIGGFGSVDDAGEPEVDSMICTGDKAGFAPSGAAGLTGTGTEEARIAGRGELGAEGRGHSSGSRGSTCTTEAAPGIGV